MSAIDWARRYIVLFPGRLHYGAFLRLLQLAQFFLGRQIGWLGRPALTTALALVWPKSRTLRLIERKVRLGPKAFRDPKAQAVLFKDRWWCPNLGLTLRASLDFGSGNLDHYLDSARLLYETDKSTEAAKLHWIQRAHILADRDAIDEFLVQHAHENDLAPEIEARALFVAGPGSGQELHKRRLKRQLDSIEIARSKPAISQVLWATKTAINAEDYETARLLLEFQQSPTSRLFERRIDAAAYETMSIHLNRAVNCFYGLNAETGFLMPNHYQILTERGQQDEHPILRRLLEELMASRHLVPQDQHPSVALFCPVHRGGDVLNVLSQAAQQNIPNAKTYLALNNLDQPIDRNMISAHWPEDRQLEICEYGEMPGIGSVIARGLKEIEEQFFLKLDADCVYGPNYASDMVMHCLSRDADITVKKAKFMHFSDMGIMDMQYEDCANRWYQDRDWAGGSAICAPTDVWRQYSNSKNARLSEDTAFLRAASFGGRRIFLADPFNHISVRRSDGKDHTFAESHIRLGAIEGSYSVCLDDMDLRKFAFA